MVDNENLGFHRKYRPRDLAHYIGNESAKEQVTKMLDSDKRVQVILLEGASGCGKTTLARIIAKEYNCENRKTGVGACNFCPSCQSMDDYIVTGDTGMLGNVFEVDIGDSSGKRDIDGVLAELEIPPMGNEWRVFIFDEIQQASAGLQNRLLKVTEEPPENVLFMFCTTNPEKLLPTLLNRCQLDLEIKKPTVKELAELLKYVCSCEGLEYDEAGVEFIANRSELTIRSALQNLNKVAMMESSAKYDKVTRVFEEVSSIYMIKFFRTLKQRDIFGFVTCICEVKAKMDLSLFLRELRSFLTRGIYTINGLVVEGVAENELKVYRDLFAEMSVRELSVLMTRLLNIDMQNIELDLLTLGYTGLVIEDKKESEVPNIPEIDGECSAELANAGKVTQQKQAEEYQKGVANVDNLMKELSLEEILMEGGTLLE